MNMRKSLALTTCLSLSFLAVACERLPDPQGPAGTPINFVELADAIPLDYGRFVAATPQGDYHAVLWFERGDQSLVGVRVGTSRTGVISKNTVVMPRR